MDGHGAEPNLSPAMNSAASPKDQQTLRSPASYGRLTKLMAPGRSRSGSTASNEAVSVTAYADDRASQSGRSTPEQRRRSGRAAVSLLASDAKYKKFAVQVERCLQSFESVNEWADFISFLSRLLKTLQSASPPYPEIPRKLIVAKRLAQCLNPALPSGVHQRALDVYTYIFSIIGPEGLRRDLLIWSSGLFPFFQFAATSVRPHLLVIYETFYLALEDELRPATKAFTLALLPGLEEETGDFFDTVLSILTRLSAAVTPTFFLSNVFLILISTPSARLAALNYLQRRIPSAAEMAESAIESGLLIRGLASAVADENMLVRRSALDLILKVVKLDGEIFANADEKDKTLLVRQVSAVVLQREISLSRRVYNWFLGGGESAAEQSEYFSKNGLSILADILRDEMTAITATTTGAGSDPQRPFKVFLSLQDKYELGAPLAERLALPALRAIKHALEADDGVADGELLATASAVYEAIEPMIVWRSPHALLESGEHTQKSSIDDFTWIATHLPQTDQAMIQVHAPILAAYLLGKARDISRPEWNALVGLTAALITKTEPKLWGNGEDLQEEEGVSAASALYDSRTDPEQLLSRVQRKTGPYAITAVFQVALLAIASGQDLRSGALHLLAIVNHIVEGVSPALCGVDAGHWVDSAALALQKCSDFVLVATAIETILLVARSPTFTAKISLGDGEMQEKLFNTLFRFLAPTGPADYARAVQLIWEVNELSPPHLLEEVVSRRMRDDRNRRAAFEAFGVLWRYTDDALLPGETFYSPSCQLIDSLKSDDPCLQQAAETWMRCNLRSYFRVLDPLIARLQAESQSKGAHQALNYSSMLYLLDSLATLLRFGGQGLSKACHSTNVVESPHPVVSVLPPRSYLEQMLHMLTELLPPPLVAPHTASQPLLLRVHSSVLENLQLLLSRGDIPKAELEMLRQRLLNELERAVIARSLALQSKMLHLLHAAMTPAPGQRGHQRYGSISEKRLSIDRQRGAANEDEESFAAHLTDTIILSISTTSNRPVLQHWIDFLLMSSNYMGQHRAHLSRLNTALTEELRRIALAASSEATCADGEAEILMLLSGLDRTLFILGQSGFNSKQDDRPHGESGGMLAGFVSTFITDSNASGDLARPDDLLHLDVALFALLSLSPASADSAAGSTEKVQDRTRKLAEKLFQAHPKALLTSLVRIWASSEVHVTDDAIFVMVDELAPSAQRVVEMLVDIMDVKTTKTYTGTEPTLAFLEAYLDRLEAPIAVQVWTPLFTFARECLATAGSIGSKAHLYPILRFLTSLSSTVAKTSALEDRRLRRDLQDVYPRVLDLVCANLSKIAEAGTWKRIASDDSDAAPLSLNDVAHGRESTEDPASQIQHYIASHILPHLRAFLLDNDKVASSCASIATSLIVPAFKQQNVPSPILELLGEMAKIPAAVRAWRGVVADAFNDTRFFRPAAAGDETAWKGLICALMDSDKERFGELLGRITAAPSANIFTNREQEMITRSYNLRRLSFVLLAAEENHYLAQLPNIQEKLVDILRTNVVSPRVHSEVYLCLRILMCRISAQHLTNFWPVILSELLRVFESLMDDLPADASEELQLVLAACKFLDLLLVMQSEDFQIHQWMFVTDTTDAIYPPEEYHAEGIMDRLSFILSEQSRSPNAMETSLVLDDAQGRPRRPRLSKVRAINSLHQLHDFFSRASIDIFEGVYSAAGIDWAAVEDSLSSEIFEYDPTVVSRAGTPRLQ